MNIRNIVAVSGLPGLFKLVATKSNGLLVADPDTGRTRFCSVRQHQFTPMETVAIYTDTDTVEIGKVFQAMLDQAEAHPVPPAGADHKLLQAYFAVIIPDYDRDRVYHSDMKKVIKWFNFLNERGYLTAEPEE
jgi:5,10-methenyltetrahydromethanopterin hydrogenase